jgi:hypothetical protein
MRLCKDCGIELKNLHPKNHNTFRCEPCQKKATKEQCRKYMKKMNPIRKANGYYDNYYKNPINRKRNYENHRETWINKKIGVFFIYSNGKMCCDLCGNDDIDVLTIDHIDGNGSKHRREFVSGDNIFRWLIINQYPDGFRVLCRNCNWKEYLRLSDLKRIV